MNSSQLKSFLKWGILIIAVIFVAVQGYSIFVNPLSTESAIYYEENDGIEASGFVIRDEKVLKTKVDGAVSYTTEDGGRVAKGSSVANIYENEQDAEDNLKITKLKTEIDSLTKAQNNTNLDAADLSVINGKINDSLLDVLEVYSSGDLTNSEIITQTLLDYLNRKQIVTGTEKNYGTLINDLKNELENCKNSLKPAKAKVKSPSSGYFVSSVDGYENSFNIKKLNEITAEDIEKVKPKENNDSGIVGKLIKGFKWYIAITMPVEKIINFTEGSTVKILTELNTCESLVVTVESVNRGIGENGVMIVSSKSMNSELVNIRTLPLKIIKNSYSGLKVNRRAVRVVDGQNGVYVVSGVTAKFVPINILYSCESYVICELQITEKKHLKVYDEVIVKGKNIYDGKIVE